MSQGKKKWNVAIKSRWIVNIQLYTLSLTDQKQKAIILFDLGIDLLRGAAFPLDLSSEIAQEMTICYHKACHLV